MARPHPKIERKEKDITAQMKFIVDSVLLFPNRLESIPMRRTLVYERIHPAMIRLLICGLDIRMNL